MEETVEDFRNKITITGITPSTNSYLTISRHEQITDTNYAYKRDHRSTN